MKYKDYYMNEGFRGWFTNAYHQMKKLTKGMKKEGVDTSDMFVTFAKMLNKKLKMTSRMDNPSDVEVKAALRQLKEIPSLAPIAIIFLAIPIPAASLLYIYIASFIQGKIGDKYIVIPDGLDILKKEEKPEIES